VEEFDVGMNATLVAALAFLIQQECQGLMIAQSRDIPATSQLNKMKTHTNIPDKPTNVNPLGIICL
jgi:hypothetical protein